jgi:V/A-type H+-transporting ATPase subunit I
MRIDLKKFLFIGTQTDQALFFEKAQEAGIIHFIEGNASKIKEVSPEIANFAAAIKVLRGLPTAPQEELTDYALADGLVAKILQLKIKLENLFEEQRIVKLEISRVGIFGNFSTSDIAYIEREGNRKAQFFFAKKGVAAQIELPPELIYIDSDHGLDYFFALNPEPKQYPKFIEMRIEQPVDVLKKRLTEIDNEIHETEQRLKNYSKYSTYLHHALVSKLNHFQLNAAKKHIALALDDQMFVVSGWVPVNKLSELQKLVADMHVHAEEIAIEPTDALPTYLENEGVNRLGEDLVHIYDTPSPTDRDPSLWILASFALFFAFIVGDGGYGLVFLAAALYIRFKSKGLSFAKVRLLNLATILCVACVIWGVLTGSFFGVSLDPDNPLREASLVQWLVEKKVAYHMSLDDSTYKEWINKYPNLKDVHNPYQFILGAYTTSNGSTNYELLSKMSDGIMMELALLIGIVHVICSMFRYLDRNWINFGWILFIVGCFLYFPSYLNAPTITQYIFHIPLAKAATAGLYLIAGGVIIATVISVMIFKLKGLLEPMTAIQVFGDIMSYLRLYALGLAGSIVSATINESLSSLNFVIGGLLIIIGHAINMALAIMGGVIHGLRLNFLEWYHYSFEGGGKMFKPLHKMKVE